jgi:hypothetical protein
MPLQTRYVIQHYNHLNISSEVFVALLVMITGIFGQLTFEELGLLKLFVC